MVLSKMTLAAALVAVGLTVAGCPSKTTSGNAPAPVPVDTSAGAKAAAVIAKVQDYTRKACKFVPTANTVANILGALGVSSVAELTGVANQICNALGDSGLKSSHPMADNRRRVPSVAGVPVHGYRVR